MSRCAKDARWNRAETRKGTGFEQPLQPHLAGPEQKVQLGGKEGFSNSQSAMPHYLIGCRLIRATP